MSRQGRKRKATLENIKDFWDNESDQIGKTPQVTIRDIYFRIHELYTILPLIPYGVRLLDVGCGTGFGTIQLARRSHYTLGTDYSESMIHWADRLIADSGYRAEISETFSPFWKMGISPTGKIEFRVSDILKFDPGINAFDIITGQRILINLPSHSDQMNAIKNLRRYGSDESYLILVEATIQGHSRTDKYRSNFGLTELEKYWHNNYVDEAKFKEWEDFGWEIKYDLGFETYMLLSKVIYPAAYGEENCEFLSGANAAAMELASLFRSKTSVEEIGIKAFLELYIERTKYYDAFTANKIDSWVNLNINNLSDWSNIGHQRLIVAKAIK